MKAIIKEIEPKLKEIFKHLHMHPEISWRENQTTEYLTSLLSSTGCRIRTFNDMTGLVAEVGNGNPVVALRADIDALWQEVEGEFQANHSCGHDAHMTIAIGVIFTLLKKGLPNRGTFRFIFQPAEEKGEGALAYVEKGVVDDVDFLYGMHLRPIQELSNGYYSPAIDHGAAKLLTGSIIGDDAHGARPHLNSNAIQVGAELIQHINNLHIDSFIPYSVKMTSFHAGGESLNVIPGSGTFSLDIRAQSNDGLQLIMNKLYSIIKMLSEYHDIEIEVEEDTHIAAAVLNDDAIRLIRESIVETVGQNKLSPVITTTGGDDFHFYTINKPDLKATMLGIGCDLQPGLHHPNMTFNFNAIPESVNILATTLLKTAGQVN